MMWLAATLFALAIATVGARAVRAGGDTPHRWLCQACGWDTDYEDEADFWINPDDPEGL